MFIEIFGYIGSALVVISMLMSSVVKLRIINTIGSVVSGIYAVIVGALPLGIMNACLIVINLWGLYKLLSSPKEYDVVESAGEESSVGFFLDTYGEDIKRYFPAFKRDRIRDKKAYTVYCEKKPAGLMLGEEKNGVLHVILDYSIPQYRDCSIGKYLYSALPDKNINVLKYTEELTDAHASYLVKMGFKKEDGAYTCRLN